MALRELYPDNIVQEVTGINIGNLDRQINQTMDFAIDQLVRICPDGQPKTEFLAAIAKEGKEIENKLLEQ